MSNPTYETLPVNEIFETMQGEATYTGTPAVFVRLQGCEVGCPWCDTKHTWSVDPDNIVPPSEMLRKRGDNPNFAEMFTRDIAHRVTKFTARHVVITGGEPCQYDLTLLTTMLVGYGCTVQVETSGTEEVRVHAKTFVTVSPKIDMPGGKEILIHALIRANEIKHPVGKQADVNNLRNLLLGLPITAPVFLQPLSQAKKATALCVAAATDSGWRVSIQTHKFAGVR